MDINNDQPPMAAPQSNPPLSRNKLKKLKRDQEWEAGRELRKQIRKEKLKEKKLKKRAAREEATTQLAIAPEDGHKIVLLTTNEDVPTTRVQPVLIPVTIILDCGFDDLMVDHERKSLGSQVTRCYSDNHKAPFQAHLVISSFGGSLKDRFENLLSGNHRSWKGVRFIEEDIVEAARQAKEWMQAPDGGNIAGALARAEAPKQGNSLEEPDIGEAVYLTSDSPHTLTGLSPYSTYIIGGLVDKNRHKGICYKKAMDAGMKTAKLPIGDYMKMNSRFVLTTNHVSEILVRWLEFGDWGEAFNRVVPKRKGGVIIEKESTNHVDEQVVIERRQEEGEDHKGTRIDH